MADSNPAYVDAMTSKMFNTNTTHPIIPSTQEYQYYRKYVSIHSEDRDVLKFPSSSEFEIEMPEDLLNVAALRLISWTFPSNYNTFSTNNNNVTMTFCINKPYNPNINGVDNLLVQKTYECLFLSTEDNYAITIEEGFYNPVQMVTELTNKFNYMVTLRLQKYFVLKSKETLSPDPAQNAILQQEYLTALQQLNLMGGYTNFVIVYNNVSQKIWFGNIADGFQLTNEITLIKSGLTDTLLCTSAKTVPDFTNWGLPSNLGLSRCNQSSVSGSMLEDGDMYVLYNGVIVPRFFYGDVNAGDQGYWLLPNPMLPGSEVHWIEGFYKINLMGQAYFYMELAGQNCIDETSPYNVSNFTLKTNGTNGVVNSSFAKISVPSTPLSQWFDRDSLPYKYYYPAAERMRRLRIKLRYHNGEEVNFGVFNYSFVIEFTLQMPQLLRSSRSITYPGR